MQSGGHDSLGAETRLYLEWRKQLPHLPLRLSLQAGLEAARFQRVPDAQSDRAILALRLLPPDTPGRLVRPYLAYVQRHQFAPTFSRFAYTRHDFSAGFSIELPLPRAPAWTLRLNGVAQRRLESAGTASTAAGVNLGATWHWSPRWNAGVDLGIGRRWYDQRRGRATREWGISPALSLEYKPQRPWFAGTDPPRIRIRLGFSRLLTTFPGGSYHQWAAGPSIHTSWPF